MLVGGQCARRSRAAVRRLAVAGTLALVAFGGVLWAAAPASAHANLVSSNPAAGTVVQEAPAEVRLRFSEPVEVARDALVVIAPDGQPLPDLHATTDPEDRTSVVAKLPSELASGTYRVRYRILSIDGHVVPGEIRFGLRDSSAPLTSGPGGGGAASVASVVPRAIAAGGALTLAGLLSYALVIVAVARRGLPEQVGTVLSGETMVRLRFPVLVTLTCALVGSLFTAIETVTATTGDLRPADLGVLLTGTRTGVLVTARLVLLLLAGSLFVWAGRRGPGDQPRPDPRLAVGLLAATLALLTFALSGHSAAAGADRGVAITFDGLHLAAVALWIGGLLGLAVVGIPSARAAGAGHPRVTGEVAAALARSFSSAAQLAMLAVLTTGGYLALLQVSTLRELTATTWGQALTVKVALWVTVLLVATLNAVTIVPRMADRAARRHQRWAAGEALASAARLELLGGLVLVVVASLMAASPPPSTVAAAPGFEATTAVERTSTNATTSGAGYDVRVRSTRVVTGGVAAVVFRVRLTTEGTPASSPAADAVLRGADGVDRTLSLSLVGAGVWISDRLTVEPGRYRLAPRFVRAGDEVVLPVRVRVP